MRELNTIFVSIDPTTNKQLALERAGLPLQKNAPALNYTPMHASTRTLKQMMKMR